MNKCKLFLLFIGWLLQSAFFLPCYALEVTGNFLYSGNTNSSNNADTFSQTIEPMIELKQDDTSLMIDVNIMRNIDGYSDRQKISQLYVARQVNEHQKILFGQGPRIPNSYEGSKSLMQQDFIEKSMLAKKFSDVFSLGIRNIASYKYVDYDIGIYDSTRYMQDIGQGTDFTGLICIKPFANDFKIGTAQSVGKYHVDYNTQSVFIEDKFKNIKLKAEYMNANGYNGTKNSKQHEQGIYTTIGYEFKNFEILGRYDYLDKTEYTAGITYKPFDNTKLMVNYTFGKDNRLLFALRFML